MLRVVVVIRGGRNGELLVGALGHGPSHGPENVPDRAQGAPEGSFRLEDICFGIFGPTSIAR